MLSLLSADRSSGDLSNAQIAAASVCRQERIVYRSILRDCLIAANVADLLRVAQMPLGEECIVGAGSFQLTEGSLDRVKHRSVALADHDALGSSIHHRTTDLEVAGIQRNVV